MSISGYFRTLALCVALPVFSLNPGGTLSANTMNGSIDGMTEQIKAGIEQVVQVVTPRYDATVEAYLKTYLEKNREKTATIIGRSAMYFPMFEEELKSAGLPVDLKYLAVVESALYPQAISPVGATGLWQFMRPTARECGLYVSKYLDERCDPVKSTRAAIKYLTALYTQFDSWELAMAAYNSGPGRVRYAIRRSGTRDYWKLQRYLPRETRAYVPGFIAASYVLNYYADHGLIPALPDNDLLETETVYIHDGMSFSEVQTVTRVPLDMICLLNPVYVRKYIPQSSSGHALVLPKYAALTMRAYLASDKGLVEVTEFEGIDTGVELEYVDRLVDEVYYVKAGDNLYNISRKHNCTVDDLKSWNRLSGTTIHIGQKLKIRKMAKVLVKTSNPAPTPVREVMLIEPLPSTFTGLSQNEKVHLPTAEQAYPQIHVRKSMVRNPMIIRRRQSLQNHKKEVAEMPADVLLPGSRIN